MERVNGDRTGDRRSKLPTVSCQPQNVERTEHGWPVTLICMHMPTLSVLSLGSTSFFVPTCN